MIKKISFALLISIVLLIAITLFFWTVYHDETLRFLVNSPITTWATGSAQADPSVVWQNLQNHQNPPDAYDDFSGYVIGSNWQALNLNGKGIVTRPSVVHAANAEMIDGELVLSVLPDPEFDREGEDERYNNAYAIGFQGYAPTTTQNIIIEARLAIDPDFHGSTGLWVEEKDTFDLQTGKMLKPFRSFGISFLGTPNKTFLAGMQLEAVDGFIPVCAQSVLDVDPSQMNLYTMVWSLKNEKQMEVVLYVNKVYSATCDFPVFYNSEIQLWADNYLVNDLTIGHQNVPNIDQTGFDFVSVRVVDK